LPRCRCFIQSLHGMFCRCCLPCFLHGSLLFLPPHHRDHRDLLSFPTRRSSDLAGPETTINLALGNARARFSSNFALILRKSGSGDRKSTRLNSSHVSVSYAVFCLKKKKRAEC